MFQVCVSEGSKEAEQGGLFNKQSGGDIRLRGPWRIAKPSMKRQDPRVNASANLRGFIATTC
jgi:hypothetical protein